MQIYNIPIDREKMETTQHGTSAFPLALYETVLTKNVLGFIDWHWHNEFQFCYITRGQIQITALQNVYVLSAGMGIFINSSILHMAKPLTKDATYLCIDVHPSLLSAFPGSIIESNYISPLLSDKSRSSIPLITSVSWQNTILDQLTAIHHEYSEKAFGYELSITRRLLTCIYLLLCELPPTIVQQQTADTLRLKTLTTYICSHYSEKITLSQLAASVGLCSNECCRYFKKHMNCTLFEYINNVRISKSSEALLGKPHLSISQIAYEHGFSTTSYYIQSFKRATGITPGEFRSTRGTIE
ncbi:AraC family transcriptional regulator [Anaerotignum sp.]|uniref:AraC family transcriptional regulator n=1 Tax=Anaerotignum sp. TaxID=2039241 RepID=UPI002714AAC7|nr:AraC family transcriptional regulator [Anaerotignum sp.]